MKPYYEDESVTLYLGDCLAVMAGLGDASVDAVVTDPPYGLEFMGREWDGADGFRRSLNAADAGRDNVFGRTSRTSPEYKTGKPSSARIRQPSERDRQPCAAHNATTSLVTRNVPDAYVAGHLFQQWCEAWARECLRVLKPGGWMLAFGGTRTWHRLTCAVEDAGFEIRAGVADLTGIDGPGLLWVHGQGFPKSRDVSKAIDAEAGAVREPGVPGRYNSRRPRAETTSVSAYHDGIGDAGSALISEPATAAAAAAAAWSGWGTALKPAWEPVVVARKPLAGTVAQNVLEYGTGALNIAGCAVGADVDTRRSKGRNPTAASAFPHSDDAWKPHLAEAGSETGGRWPPDVVLGEAAAAELDRQSGVLTSGANPARRSSDKFRDAYGEFTGQEECVQHRGANSGGASRFFPVFRYEPKAPPSERPRLPDGTAHPTVKPLDLIRWLVRLVTPPGGLVLDPFAGSGTTGEACVVEGFRAVLAEQDPAAAELSRLRLVKPIQPVLFGGDGLEAG